jgi:hypothetical protein
VFVTRRLTPRPLAACQFKDKDQLQVSPITPMQVAFTQLPAKATVGDPPVQPEQRAFSMTMNLSVQGGTSVHIQQDTESRVTAAPVTPAAAAEPDKVDESCACRDSTNCTCTLGCRGFGCRHHSRSRTRTHEGGDWPVGGDVCPSPALHVPPVYRDWREADAEVGRAHVRRHSVSHSMCCACRGSGIGCHCLLSCACGSRV